MHIAYGYRLEAYRDYLSSADFVFVDKVSMSESLVILGNGSSSGRCRDESRAFGTERLCSA